MDSQTEMTGPRHRLRRLRIVVPLAAVAIVGAACGGGSGSGVASAATVAAAKDAKLGQILVDGKGRTLYLFEKDSNGTSSCDGPCAQVWPPATTSGAPQVGTRT